LEKVKNHPNFINHYRKKKFPGFRSIHYPIYSETIKLVDSFENIGIPYWKNNHIHPFGDNGLPEYTKLALAFKQKYRFGMANEGYSSLQNVIQDISAERISRYLPKLIFKPDERKFNLRASFYTWVPSIDKALKYIFDNINTHSNLNGIERFDSKEVELDINRNSEQNSISLSITDIGSLCKRNSEDVLKDFRRSEAFNRYFRSLCDWSVILYNGEKSYRLNILKRIEDDNLKADIEKIEEPPTGFTHIITFYGT